jgi:hypothetical protein
VEGGIPTKFIIRPHQGKEEPYVQALLAAGHEMSMGADVVLIDFEIPHPGYERYVNYAKSRGIPLVAYPHGAAQVGQHQLTREPHKCAMTFVHGPGQVWLRLTYGYPNPVHAVGYPKPRKPLEPREPNHVLFAPHHPLGSGWMPDDARQANTDAFRTILRDRDFELTVRLIGSLEQNGLWEERGVNYIHGQMDGSVNEADVAVAGGTYAANSLCEGIPVVMYNQLREWRVELEGHESKMVPDWRKFEEYTRYPFDLGTWPESLHAAAKRSMYPSMQEWIGKWMPPWEPQRFAKLVEKACRIPVS